MYLVKALIRIILASSLPITIAAMNISTVTSHINNQFFIAVKNNAIEQINYLLDHGMSVHCTDDRERTPLHLAAAYNKIAVITLLFNRGAYIESKNAYGRTPLHLAALWLHQEAIRVLLDNGANIESKDNNGETPRDYVLKDVTNSNWWEVNTIKHAAQQALDAIEKNKFQYINMSAKPATLLGIIIMYMLKKSKGNYIGTAQQVAQIVHDERAQEFLQRLSILSTPDKQKQEAKCYLKYYLERQQQ